MDLRRIFRGRAGVITVMAFTILLLGCKSGSKIVSIESSFIEFSNETVPVEDSAMTALIEPYKSKLDKDMNAVLAQCEQDMGKGNPEGLLGNFIADLTLAKTNQYCKEANLPPADITMLNNGGLRTTLIKGPIYKKRIYELMPFENEMVVLTISGEKMKSLFDFLARIGGMPVSALTMVIVDGKPTEMTVGGKPFDIKNTYRVATSDYLAEGGDKMRFFLDPIKRDNLVHKLRDAIIEYVEEKGQQGEVITAKLDGRIKIKQ
ncbi:MAG: 5'-nucleotidase C-terminal domain-containing protein [Flavobacteriales bacterium]|nr:5'-nucleotidase C-terminal domain-containing protein [Flavobacteriales bacterium]